MKTTLVAVLGLDPSFLQPHPVCLRNYLPHSIVATAVKERTQSSKHYLTTEGRHYEHIIADVGMTKIHGSQVAEPFSANKAPQISPMGSSKKSSTVLPTSLCSVLSNPTEALYIVHSAWAHHFSLMFTFGDRVLTIVLDK